MVIHYSDPAHDLTITQTESSGTGTLGFNASADNGHKIRYGGTGTNADLLKFVGVGDLERMRINTHGDILFGQISTNAYQTDVGHSFRATGFATHTRDQGVALLLNRTTTDGQILQLRKDNLLVGSFSTNNGTMTIASSGNSLTLGCNGSNLHLDSGTLRPFSADDNTIDLGNSTCRYKDTYLSGGVYLGGTVNANKLDDYEEGNWFMLMITRQSYFKSIFII